MNPHPVHRVAARRPRSRAVIALLGALLTFGLVAGACSSDDTTTPATTSTSTTAVAPKVTGDVTVSAAASLKETFTQIGKDFESANPGAKVTINFGSSGDLATQIQSGAPVDVAAFAAESNMTTLSDASLLDGSSEAFATNSLVIVTKPGNPKKIKGLADLATVARSGGTISLCATTAPCGKYADQILQGAKVAIPGDKVTRGQDVRATLTAVTDGDADAAIVYVTDAKAAGDAVDSVEIPTDQNAVAKYPIAVIKATTNAAASKAFMTYVMGTNAQKVLSNAGFGAP
ncbi:MAG TPA: molybdate ABC transporter substrate-binding protein [Microthrixaceae bacterium]|nr:molybdate ABC transporter substrate-binding protein [Microthrixaceae bacterium]